MFFRHWCNGIIFKWYPPYFTFKYVSFQSRCHKKVKRQRTQTAFIFRVRQSGINGEGMDRDDKWRGKAGFRPWLLQWKEHHPLQRPTKHPSMNIMVLSCISRRLSHLPSTWYGPMSLTKFCTALGLLTIPNGKRFGEYGHKDEIWCTCQVLGISHTHLACDAGLVYLYIVHEY